MAYCQGLIITNQKILIIQRPRRDQEQCRDHIREEISKVVKFGPAGLPSLNRGSTRLPNISQARLKTKMMWLISNQGRWKLFILNEKQIYLHNYDNPPAGG